MRSRSTDVDDPAVLAKIAHIEAHSDNGPRANPNLSQKDRNSYPNLILLCGTHHDLIDYQSNTYTVADLRRWKIDLETSIKRLLSDVMTKTTYTELEQVVGHIVNNSKVKADSKDYTVIPPRDKMEKNQLNDLITDQYITMGMIQFQSVKEFIEHMTQLVENYPMRLIDGFVEEYNRLRNEKGLVGDELFLGMVDFASSNSSDVKKRAAGIAVLTYLFTICEVFEK